MVLKSNKRLLFQIQLETNPLYITGSMHHAIFVSRESRAHLLLIYAHHPLSSGLSITYCRFEDLNQKNHVLELKLIAGKYNIRFGLLLWYCMIGNTRF